MISNFEHTFIHFIKALNVPVTKTGALEHLLFHPDEGSMLAYSETLSHFKIENVGIQIDQERIHELPTPFIAYLHQYGGSFTLVKKVTEKHVSLLDTKKGWKKISVGDFLKSWQGIALLAETTSESGEKDYSRKRKNEILGQLRVPLAVALFALTISIFSISFIFNSPTPLFPILIILKTGGMIASSLLLIKSLGNKNELVNQLCNNGPKVNCQNILDSPAAQLTSWLSWADLGFIYFFGSFFALLFSLSLGVQSTLLSFQWIFGLSGAIFGVYSLWYQGIKAKMWCTLCLAVVSIFVLELLTLLSFSSFSINVDKAAITYIFAGFLIPVFFLLIFKIPALKSEEVSHLKKTLNKIYANPQYFKSLMENQPVMPSIPPDMPIIALGNKDASHTITMVSNPLCTPCATMHQKLEELMAETSDINCQVVFLSGENNAGGQFVRKLLSLPQNIQPTAMSEWYQQNDKNFEKWNNRYKAYDVRDEAVDFQKMHNEWVNYAEIKATPTLFINNRKKPADLGMEELNSIFILQRVDTLDEGFANQV